MTRKSLQMELFIKASEGLKVNSTRAQYKRACKKFAKFAKKNNVNKIEKITKELIQEYSYSLQNNSINYKASTIHTYLSPICKSINIDLREIDKPKRTSDKITKGREDTSNLQGKRQEENPKFGRLINLQKAIGIRRNELTKLKGEDLVLGADKRLYVHVKNGKGGKEQFQLILPDDESIVSDIFSRVSPNENVFSKEEMNNQINLHALRREHAIKTYNFFQKKISNDPIYKKNLKIKLIETFELGNKELLLSNRKKYEAKLNKFKRDLNERPYLLRGKNKNRALQNGRPIEYNRLALMSASVFALSHWRLDVTVVNYIV